MVPREPARGRVKDEERKRLERKSGSTGEGDDRDTGTRLDIAR